MYVRMKNIALQLDDFHLEADLDLPRGELISLLGPSGCGKTTLLKILSGLYFPDRGEIHLGDRDITRLAPRYRKIGMVFQDYALFPHMDVEKNICYGMKEKGPEAIRKSEELLALVQLEGYSNRKPDELSGGEKQRVALARALAGSPDILLLDEPLSALDAKLRRNLRRQIREIQLKTGITAVYVTHDQEEAMAISDRIVLMNEGRIRQVGTPEELYARPADPFCGGFIGTANLIRIREWQSPGDRTLIALTDHGDFTLPHQLFDRKNPGSHLYFRPEDCLIGELVPQPARQSEGTILYREYGGDCQIIEVESGDGLIRIKSPASPPLKQGQKVNWTIAAENCLII